MQSIKISLKESEGIEKEKGKNINKNKQMTYVITSKNMFT